MSFRDLEAAVISQTNATFGVSATYTPTVGAPVSLTGVFDNAYVLVADTQSLRPILRIKLSDLAAMPDQGDQVTVNSVTYHVIESQEDGYGGSTLVLHKV